MAGGMTCGTKLQSSLYKSNSLAESNAIWFVGMVIVILGLACENRKLLEKDYQGLKLYSV
jgi:hypothetical protein